jgi:hypothetical protein
MSAKAAFGISGGVPGCAAGRQFVQLKAAYLREGVIGVGDIALQIGGRHQWCQHQGYSICVTKAERHDGILASYSNVKNFIECYFGDNEFIFSC